jgi:hypothetical protein
MGVWRAQNAPVADLRPHLFGYYMPTQARLGCASGPSYIIAREKRTMLRQAKAVMSDVLHGQSREASEVSESTSTAVSNGTWGANSTPRVACLWVVGSG